jgi:hypothetical protein
MSVNKRKVFSYSKSDSEINFAGLLKATLAKKFRIFGLIFLGQRNSL